MFDTRPVGRHRVYVCTNISCSLNGGRRAVRRASHAQVGDDPDIHVRHFECLGACDIAPMASVDGVYVGPIELDEVPELVEQIRAGEPVLPDKQLRRKRRVACDAERRRRPGAADAPSGAADARRRGPGPVGAARAAARPARGPEPTS